MDSASIDALLFHTRDVDPNRRRRAVHELRPCEVRANDSRVWNQILELVGDLDVGLRRLAFRAMIDGSPRGREADVVEAVESLRDDPSPRLRRQARKLLASYRRTGKISIGTA
jgi:hypothetical protein